MEPTTSHRLRNSLIQLIVGTILVGLSVWYLTGHPAERQSIKSSISTVGQKISQWTSSTRGVDTSSIDQQQTQARNSLSEIIDAIKSCSPSTSVAEYQVLYDTLTTSSLEEFARNSANYFNQLGSAYQKMQELCNNKPATLDR